MEFSFKIGAMAGEGAFVAGKTLGRVFARCGYNVVGYPEYPSLIKGGHNSVQIVISDEPVYSPRQKVDVLIAVNKEAVFFHKDAVNQNGTIIYDASINTEKLQFREDLQQVKLPAISLLNELKAPVKLKNTVFVAAALAQANFPIDVFLKLLEDEFSRKGKEIVEMNQNVAKKAYEFVKANSKTSISLKEKVGEPKPFVFGNEIFGIGAIRAGVKLYVSYPMTPASSLLTFFVSKRKKHGIAVFQNEDEIAAMNAAIGSNYAGVRSMTGTSGGGFALMTEAVSMSANAETPSVTFLAQRTGPSTGMPTWTEQADLFQVLGAGQGDFLKIILASGSAEELFYHAGLSFNLAEKYQLPVFVLSDKFLSESYFTVNADQSKIQIERGDLIAKKDENKMKQLQQGERFKRYAFSETGVSPRTIPGVKNGQHVATSYEHEEDSFSTEHFEKRAMQVEKRAKKINALEKDFLEPKIYGNEKSENAIAVWGSQLLPALDAQNFLKKEGIETAIIHFNWLYPLYQSKVEKIWEKFENIAMFENNFSGQFSSLLKMQTGLYPDTLVAKYNGRQFFPEQIAEAMKQLVKSEFKEQKISLNQELENYEYFKPWSYTI